MFGYVDNDKSGNANSLPLTVDGAPVSQGEGYVSRHNGRLTAYITGASTYSHAINCTYSDITSNFDEVILSRYWYGMEFDDFYLESFSICRLDGDKFRFSCRFGFDIAEWRHLWTMVDHAWEFMSILEDYNFSIPVYETQDDDDDYEDVLNGFQVFTIIDDPKTVINTTINVTIPLIETAHRQTVRNLSRMTQSNSVAVTFDFPPEIRVACEQYLVYFVQFLRDIGIEASAELREEANHLLFSVTPKDKKEALDHIREALGIYLRLPSNPNVGLSTPTASDIEVQRLVANIHHLNGQLALAGAVLQQKDILIQQQQSFIHNTYANHAALSEAPRG